jgi:hypothetical protein
MQKFFVCFVEKSGATLLAGVIVLSARRLESSAANYTLEPKAARSFSWRKTCVIGIIPPLTPCDRKNPSFLL